MRLFLATPFWVMAIACGLTSDLLEFTYYCVAFGKAHALRWLGGRSRGNDQED